MPKHKSRHKCPKQCTCSQVEDLTKLYKELKCLRKEAKKAMKATQVEFRMSDSEIEMVENDPTTYNFIVTVIQEQRENMRSLMASLRELNEKLAGQEEEICQVDREITDVQDQICLIKEKFNNSKCSSDIVHEKNQETEINEALWKEAVALEIQEQNQLQDKINKMSDCLEKCKVDEKIYDEHRREQNKMDIKILLDAINNIEKCINDSKALISR